MADEVYELIKKESTSIASQRCHETRGQERYHVETGSSRLIIGPKQWKRSADGSLIGVVHTGYMEKKQEPMVPDTYRAFCSSRQSAECRRLRLSSPLGRSIMRKEEGPPPKRLCIARKTETGQKEELCKLGDAVPVYPWQSTTFKLKVSIIPLR